MWLEGKETKVYFRLELRIIKFKNRLYGSKHEIRDDWCSKGAHTLKAVLREAGMLAGRQGLVNTVIHWSPHTDSRSWSRQEEQEPAPALSVWNPMYYRVYQTLPASQPASFSSRKNGLSVWTSLA